MVQGRQKDVISWFSQRENKPKPALRSDEGITLETSAFNLFTVANLPYQLSW